MRLLVFLLFAFTIDAAAQGFSGRTITIVVPFTPGTGADQIARLVSPKLADKLGAAVVVDNRAGASGAIGAEMVAKSAPDGHVMLIAGKPRKMAPAEPMVDGTEQWEVPIIDSSKSGHGPADTRNRGGEKHDGVGEGVLRVYTNRSGKLAGYTWSPARGSHFSDPKEHPLAIGRLDAKFRP